MNQPTNGQTPRQRKRPKQMANQTQAAGRKPKPTAEGSSAPAGEPDELDKELATLGKRKRKDLRDLVRTVGAPVGGWFDKQGKFHVTHAELANHLNRQLARAWAALDSLRSADFMSAIADFAHNNEKFKSSVYEAKDNLHDLLDELDTEAFTFRIKHQEGYATY